MLSITLMNFALADTKIGIRMRGIIRDHKGQALANKVVQLRIGYTYMGDLGPQRGFRIQEYRTNGFGKIVNDESMNLIGEKGEISNFARMNLKVTAMIMKITQAPPEAGSRRALSKAPIAENVPLEMGTEITTTPRGPQCLDSDDTGCQEKFYTFEVEFNKTLPAPPAKASKKK